MAGRKKGIVWDCPAVVAKTGGKLGEINDVSFFFYQTTTLRAFDYR